MVGGFFVASILMLPFPGFPSKRLTMSFGQDAFFSPMTKGVSSQKQADREQIVAELSK